MILSITQLIKYFGAAPVLQGINATILEGDRIGLIGVNGAGKSTLLNIIYGDLDADSGEIAYGSGVRIGFLRQDSGLSNENTIVGEMRAACEDIVQTEAAMRLLEEEMSGIDPHSPAWLEKMANYNRLQDIFEARQGYQIETKIATVLNGMGFGDMPADTPVLRLSGGERTRLAICKLLLQEPELLILDEPTNHLDFKTLSWLESYLVSYKGAVLLVSHDRYFLDKLCTAIWELEHHVLSIYRGNYSRFLLQKEERLERQRREYEQQQEEIAHLKDFVARNLTRASTSARAKSKRKALERMEIVEKPKPPPKAAKLRFRTRSQPVTDLLQIEDMCLCVGEGSERRELFSHLNLALRKGDKVAIIGLNGIGKSSFLKAIQGMIPVEKGDIYWGQGVEISYFEQGDLEMDLYKTALGELWDRFPRETEHTIRTVLGQVRLTGENVFKQVGQLSGGERAKLKLARLVLSCGNVLLMDEPTNHLDLPAKETLDTALQSYDGTLLVVSHDRYLLNKFPDWIAEMSPEGLCLYKGKYDDYLLQKEAPRPHAQALPEGAAELPLQKERGGSYRSKKDRVAAVAQKTRLNELEQQIEALEARIFELECEISLPEIARNYLLSQEKCELLDELRLELDCAMSEWTALADEML